MFHLSGENQLHGVSLPYRVDEPKRQQSHLAGILHCDGNVALMLDTQLPVTRRARILPRSLM